MPNARTLPLLLLGALVLAGCGSSPPPPKYLPGVKPLPMSAGPLAVVRQALEATSHTSYDEVVSLDMTIDTSDVPAAEAERIRAKLASRLARPEVVSADVTDLADFQISEGRSLSVRADHGVYSVSLNGGKYQQIPSSQANTLFDTLQSDVASSGGVVKSAKAIGRARVAGISVERYRALISSAAIKKQAAGLLSLTGPKLPAGTSLVVAPETVDVDRATGYPVRLIDSVRMSVNLAVADHGTAVGVLVIRVTGTHTFSHVRPHRT